MSSASSSLNLSSSLRQRRGARKGILRGNATKAKEDNGESGHPNIPKSGNTVKFLPSVNTASKGTAQRKSQRKLGRARRKADAEKKRLDSARKNLEEAVKRAEAAMIAKTDAEYSLSESPVGSLRDALNSAYLQYYSEQRNDDMGQSRRGSQSSPDAREGDNFSVGSASAATGSTEQREKSRKRLLGLLSTEDVNPSSKMAGLLFTDLFQGKMMHSEENIESMSTKNKNKKAFDLFYSNEALGKYPNSSIRAAEGNGGMYDFRNKYRELFASQYDTMTQNRNNAKPSTIEGDSQSQSSQSKVLYDDSGNSFVVTSTRSTSTKSAPTRLQTESADNGDNFVACDSSQRSTSSSPARQHIPKIVREFEMEVRRHCSFSVKRGHSTSVPEGVPHLHSFQNSESESLATDNTSIHSSDSWTTADKSTATSLSKVSISQFSCVKESQPLGGPKYYICSNTKTGQARVVHEAMPSSLKAVADERGYEVVDYHLVKKERNGKSSSKGARMLGRTLSVVSDITEFTGVTDATELLDCSDDDEDVDDITECTSTLEDATLPRDQVVLRDDVSRRSWFSLGRWLRTNKEEDDMTDFTDYTEYSGVTGLTDATETSEASEFTRSSYANEITETPKRDSGCCFFLCCEGEPSDEHSGDSTVFSI